MKKVLAGSVAVAIGWTVLMYVVLWLLLEYFGFLPTLLAIIIMGTLAYWTTKGDYTDGS
jgi:hypothetical protein